MAWLGAGAKTAAGYGHMSYEEQLSNTFFKSDEEKRAARLAESGIVMASSTWPKAHITEVSPGSGDITVTYEVETGKKEFAKGKFYNELSKSTQEKAKKKKAYIEVDIERQGNQVLITAVREIPAG